MIDLLTPQQIADRLNVKVSTIYQWTHQDYIPHVKIGRLVRFRENDINKWLEAKSTNGRLTHKINISDIGL